MLPWSRWPYIQTQPLSGDLAADITGLLTAHGKRATAAHCLAVAEVGATLAARFALDEHAVVTAALLHDVAAIVRPQDMLAYAVEQGWALDACERQHPFLLHQRLSALLAEAVFGVREAQILSAIACHTTLRAHPSACDIAVFLSDKLAGTKWAGRPITTSCGLPSTGHWPTPRWRISASLWTTA